MNEADRLIKTLAFRVTAKEAESVEALVKRQERRPSDVLRRIFKKGLKAEERAK